MSRNKLHPTVLMEKVFKPFHLEFIRRGFRDRLEVATVNLIRTPLEPLKDTVSLETIKVWTLRYDRDGGEYTLNLKKSGYYTNR